MSDYFSSLTGGDSLTDLAAKSRQRAQPGLPPRSPGGGLQTQWDDDLRRWQQAREPQEPSGGIGSDYVPDHLSVENYINHHYQGMAIPSVGPFTPAPTMPMSQRPQFRAMPNSANIDDRRGLMPEDDPVSYGGEPSGDYVSPEGRAWARQNLPQRLPTTLPPDPSRPGFVTQGSPQTGYWQENWNNTWTHNPPQPQPQNPGQWRGPMS